MHPTSGDAKTWRVRKPTGYWRREWRRPGSRKKYNYSEHRWVWEAIHGRKLQSWEAIHHRDEDKGNNDPSNLVLVTRQVHGILHGKDRAIEAATAPRPTHKVCARCRENKPASAFQQSMKRSQSDARIQYPVLHSYCKACMAAYSHDWYLRHRA